MKLFLSNNFLFGIFLLLTICNCNRLQENNCDENIPIQLHKMQIQTRFLGEWKYYNSIWYSSQIDIKDNGTFVFYDHSCSGQNFTKGDWKLYGDTIVLSSYEVFRHIEEIDDASMSYKKNVEIVLLTKINKNKYIFTGLKKENVTPKITFPNDTIKIYFEKVLLCLKKDTLFCLDTYILIKRCNFYHIN